MAQTEPTERRPGPRDRQPTPAAQRRAEGRARRGQCPRSSHAQLGPLPNERDVIAMIKASNEDRIESLLPIRYQRMLQSPFAFFRGTANLQAADLAQSPASGIRVQACGDAHLANFGGFATPERHLVFDVNDFDETFPAPWEWDVKRLCASLALAARSRAFPAAAARDAANAAAARYRERIDAYAGMSTLEVWYSRVDFDEVQRLAKPDRKFARLVDADVERARNSTSEHVYGKITTEADGAARIVDEPPLLFHIHHDLHATGHKFLGLYAATLRDDFRALLARFRPVDAAVKVVGIGSVGTRCYAVLMLGEQGEPLFLQIKEARRSVLEPHSGPSPWRNHGERVVAGQHLMQAVSDIFLGWSGSPEGRDFYVRQLRDMKIAIEIEQLDPSGLVLYGQLCASALARAHAKAGQAAPVAGYLGSSTAFDDAIEKYAVGYAELVERDYETFRNAARTGAIRTETATALAETTIV
jgi:uncharacterized protein (DUF2252 family)